MKKATKLTPREISILAIVLLLILDIFFFQSLPSVSTVRRFFLQVESRVYDYRTRMRAMAGREADIIALQQDVDQKNFEVGSKAFIEKYDNLSVKSPASKDIVILAIDEKTMDDIGQWPIKRDQYKKLLDRLIGEGGARAVAFDIVFSERSDQAGIQALQDIRDNADPEVKQVIDEKIKALDYDHILTEAFAKYPQNIIAGYTTLSSSEILGSNKKEVTLYEKNMSINFSNRGDWLEALPRYQAVVANFDELQKSLKWRGFYTVMPDGHDGTVRKASILTRYPAKMIGEDGKLYESQVHVFPSLSFATFLAFQGVKSTPEPLGSFLYLGSMTDLVLKDTVHDALKAKVESALLSFPGLTPFQKQLLQKIVDRQDYHSGRYMDFNRTLAKYSAGSFAKTESMDMGFYLEMDMLRTKQDFIIEHIFRDWDKATRKKFMDSESIEEFKIPLETVYKNLDKNLAHMVEVNLLDPVRWSLDNLYSFRDGLKEKLLEHARKQLAVSPEFIKQFFNQENLHATDKGAILADMDGTAYIPYRGIGNDYVYYSFADVVLRDKFSGTFLSLPTPEVSLKEAFQDKIVLIGPTAVGINDWRVTPVGRQVNGVEIHANIVDMLRHGDQIIRGRANLYTVAILFLLSVVVSFLLNRLSALWGLLITGALLFSYMSFCGFMFDQHHLYFQFVPVGMQLLIFYILLYTRNYFLEERERQKQEAERKKTRDAFQHYVNASVVDQVLNDPDKLKLGGDRKQISVLFSDVRSFTTISEGLSPEDLVALMNEYLTDMTDLVLQYDGTLDKFIGDAVMAFWGAPIEQEDHIFRSVSCAIDMNYRIEEMRSHFLEKYNVPIYVGIGINTGPAVVGNMGSKSRFDYTMLGDTVNLGARLEGQTKNYGADLIIGENTFKNLPENFAATRFLDLIAVKGKTEPVKIYECPKYIKDCDDRFLEGLAKFNEAVDKYYMGRNFKEGIQVFQDLKEYRGGEDKACDLYIERCTEFLENPPADEWDGVFVATSK